MSTRGLDLFLMGAAVLVLYILIERDAIPRVAGARTSIDVSQGNRMTNLTESVGPTVSNLITQPQIPSGFYAGYAHEFTS